jgi:hypothetical protein
MIYWVYAYSLLLSCLIEGGLMALLFRRRDFIYYTALCNLLTNPALNLLLHGMVYRFGAACYWPALLALEFVVWFAEAGILKQLCGFRLNKAMAVSLLLNFSSFLIGEILGAVLY